MGLFDGGGKFIAGFETWRARGGVDIQWVKTRADGATILALMAPEPYFFYLRPKDGIVDLVWGTQAYPGSELKVAFEVGNYSTPPADVFKRILVKMGELAGDIRDDDDDDDDESLELGWVIVGFSLLLARGVREWHEHYRFVEQYMIPISLRFRGKLATISSIDDLLSEPMPASEHKRLTALRTQVTD